MTTTDTKRTWPSHDDWEAAQRARAEHLIEHGAGYEFEPTFTDAERGEITTLAPVIVKAIRRECVRIERPLRAEHPEVVWLLKPSPVRYLSGEYDTAMEALSADQRAALDTLQEMRDIRRELRREFVGNSYPHPHEWRHRQFRDLDRFASPELDRVRKLHQQAIARYRDQERQRGRTLLAALDSGVEWLRELKHRTEIEEYFANGPLIR